jgi:hypothetical protein
MELLNQFPEELTMDLDWGDDSSDHTSTCAESQSTISSQAQSHLALPQVQLPVYDFGNSFGLHSLDEGFVALPNHKTFSQVLCKTAEMIRDEKLHALDPFIGALNEGDIFSLFSICQFHCQPEVIFQSNSCGFKFQGCMSVIAFWAMLFEKHYQGRIQILNSRVNSAIKPRQMTMISPDNGMFESAEFVIKLEGCRLSQFNNFEIYQALMLSGYIHNDLSLPELVSLTEAFYKQYITGLTMMQQQQPFAMMAPKIHRVVYLFEVNLKFHAITHAISQWNFEVLGVESY